MNQWPLIIRDLNVWTEGRQRLDHVNLQAECCRVLSIIGPMGSGKSTLVRCNRLYDEVPGSRIEGIIEINGKNIYDPNFDLFQLRRDVAMTFAEPRPFKHMSIFENVAIGLRLQGMRAGAVIGERVEEALALVGLWDFVRKKLHKSTESLRPGQQQLLCIARSLALKPEILLLDEPTSMVGLQDSAIIEQLIRELSQKLTIVLTTNSRKQAARISDRTAFLLDGELIEVGKTSELFMNPKDSRTEDYLTGRFG
ncbi:MAG: phosphate ABC transporter ATP-binding protein [Bdellovibrionales bacterium]|nr:phosphate ABC transporter ATP-binding protein [Bdellovibrionales bacterium]